MTIRQQLEVELWKAHKPKSHAEVVKLRKLAFKLSKGVAK